ncbi:ferritin-like domain-containing protein, partial [Streptomyces sp. NPDC051132]
MTSHGTPPGAAAVDLGDLPLEGGARLLLRRALDRVPAGGEVAVAGRDPALVVHLTAWCRREGHTVRPAEPGDAPVRARVRRSGTAAARWAGAERAGGPGPGRAAGRAEPH